MNKKFKSISAFLMIFCICLTLMPFSVYADDVSKLAGTYEGWYYANQGQTGLTLTVEKDGTGVFEFYNMPGKSNAKNGSYTVKASVSKKGFRIDGVKWIEKPSGYGFVYLDGALDGDIYSGTVSGNKWEFVLNKNNESYQQIYDSVYKNHRYEVFDEGLTWHEAKAKCESMGGHLVTITSEEEQKHVESLLEGRDKNQYWIGACSESGNFEWVTGESFSYTNWDSSEPNSHSRSDGEKEQYVHIYNVPNPAVGGSKRFKWNDIYFDNTYPGEESYFSIEHAGYICEWETWSDSAQWSTPELQEAAQYNLIPDTLVGKDMTKPITRGEFAAVSVKLFEEMTGGKAVMSSQCSFGDISSDENRNYILKAYNIGAVNGMSQYSYEPKTLLSREQLATMLTRVYKRSQWPEWSLETDDNYTINYSGVTKFADDTDISEYAKPSVYFMVKYNVLSGIGNNLFAPKNVTPGQEAVGYANATREQALIMSLRSFKNLK